MKKEDLENLTHTGYIKTREAVESRSNLLDKFTQKDEGKMDEGEALHKRENVTEGNKNRKLWKTIVICIWKRYSTY